MAPAQLEVLSLTLPSAIDLNVTPEQFEALSAANRELKLERTSEGVLIVNPPTGGESGRRNFNITGQLARWCDAHPEMGEGFDSSTGFRLPNGANRSPDLSWIRQERWDSLTPEQRKGFIPLCPDLVVKLRSESDSLANLQTKMQEYMENGARLGWLIDPQNQQVEVYRTGREVVELKTPVSLSGEDILPGFRLDTSLLL